MKLYVCYCGNCDIGRVSKDSQTAQKQAEQHALSVAFKGKTHMLNTFEVEVGPVHGAPGAVAAAVERFRQ